MEPTKAELRLREKHKAWVEEVKAAKEAAEVATPKRKSRARRKK